MILPVENALKTVVFFHLATKVTSNCHTKWSMTVQVQTHKKIEAEIDVGFGDG